jgi:membrane protein
MILLHFWHFLKKLVNNWSVNKISSQAAALSFYAVFSLAPILLICIFIVGIVYGEEAARGQIMKQVSGIVGADSGLKIQELIMNVNKPRIHFLTKLLSFLIILFTASGIFSEMQQGLNNIWGVKTKKSLGWFSIIKNRLLSFGMVIGIAVLLLTSFLLSTFLALLNTYMNHFMGINILMELTISYLLSFFINTLLFAMLFKFLPDVDLNWHDVWLGALITSLLFSMGKIFIAVYLNQFHIYSVFGAAGFLIVILVWVFYSSQIFFYRRRNYQYPFYREREKSCTNKKCYFD